ncbi:MAG: conjugal transfer protein TraX [Clostridiales bacterium]|jgi:hypothetical protein|nr:conjugal transfer protein TraX [Clostridiales bacterium]
MKTEANNPAWRILSGTQVKILGVALMAAYYTHKFFSSGINALAPAWLGMIGQAYPALFLFTASEGLFYTHSRKRYVIQLLIGYEIMNLLNVLASSVMLSEIMLFDNAFGTLFFMSVYVILIDRLKEELKEGNRRRIATAVLLLAVPVLISAVSIVFQEFIALLTRGLSITSLSILMVAILAVPNLFLVDGGIAMVGLGVIFYCARNWRFVQIAVIVSLSIASFAIGDGWRWMMVFAAVPIFLYNGKRGAEIKHFFYIYYPALVYALYFLAWFLPKLGH